MNKQFERKYRWHVMAWGMALGYITLHHGLTWASFHAPARESSWSQHIEWPERQATSGVDHQHHQLPPAINAEYLWPVGGKGECQLVTLSVDALAMRGSDKGEQGEMPVNAALCHAKL